MSVGRCFMRHPPVEGRLFTFGDDPSRPLGVFMTGSHKRTVVIVGGQTDQFLSLLSIRPLMEELEKNGWSVAQTQLASSCFDNPRSHVGDAEDLATLMNVLVDEFDINEVTLFAWSNGVQVAMEYLSSSKNAEVVTRVILQGVVTKPDEGLFTDESQQMRVRCAEQMVSEGKKTELVPHRVYDQPMSASRLATGGFPTLMEALWVPAFCGDAGERLKKNLSCIKVPLFVLVASVIEYGLNNETKKHFVEMMRACATTTEVDVCFTEADCDEERRMLKGTETEHAAAMILFLQEQDKKRADREEEDRQLNAEEARRQRSILASSGFQ